MGANLLWILITSNIDWWKKILWKKYFQGPQRDALKEKRRITIDPISRNY
jgi:hypothetical protein